MVTEKLCPHCGVVKPASLFYPDEYNSSRLSSWCKDCERERKARARVLKEETKDETEEPSFVGYDDPYRQLVCMLFLDTLETIGSTGASLRADISRMVAVKWLNGKEAEDLATQIDLDIGAVRAKAQELLGEWEKCLS